MIASTLNGLTLENQRPSKFLLKKLLSPFSFQNSDLHKQSLFKVNNFVISELTKHVSKCKKYDKRFAKKVAELEFKLVLDFHIYRSSCLEVFCRKDVLEISQNSQENTSARDYFSIKLQGLHLY